MVCWGHGAELRQSVRYVSCRHLAACLRGVRGVRRRWCNGAGFRRAVVVHPMDGKIRPPGCVRDEQLLGSVKQAAGIQLLEGGDDSSGVLGLRAVRLISGARGR